MKHWKFIWTMTGAEVKLSTPQAQQGIYCLTGLFPGSKYAPPAESKKRRETPLTETTWM